MMQPHLLIDVKNALYRAIFAVKAQSNYREFNRNHYLTALLRQMAAWINIYQPRSLHVFWDAPRNSVWRRKILPTYKDRQSNTEDISEDLSKTTAIAKEFFKNMNVRQYYKPEMEADDLIYAAVTVLHPQPSIIVSIDSDMIQIPYMYSSCKIYNPSKQAEVKLPDINPATQKAITGDKTDCIDGYAGIGPVKSKALLEDQAKLEQFFKDNGRQQFLRNMLLIDLSLNPKLLNNKLHVHKILAEPLSYDEQQINQLIMKYKVNGMLESFNELIYGYKNLK